MDITLIRTIATITFFVVIIFMAGISILAIYILNRYGRTKSITVAMSLAFGALFFLGSVAAYATLQNIF